MKTEHFAKHNDPGLISRFLRLSEDRRRRMTTEDIRPECRDIQSRILGLLHEVYGAQRGMRFSKSIHPDGFEFFASVVQELSHLERKINFLEIGSFEGVSMSVVSALLDAQGILGRLVSIDPYFEDGYQEEHPATGSVRKVSTETTMTAALRLYELLGIDVSLMRVTSDVGLRGLLCAEQEFDLIYIDGLHNGMTPTIDFGLSMGLLAKDGVIILDDWPWPDIVGLKALCDQHMQLIAETPDIAAYRR